MSHNIKALSEEPMIRIAVNSGSDAQLAAWLESERESSVGVANDSSADAARRWGVNAYPTTFFVGADGRIKTSSVGYMSELGLRARLLWAKSG